MAVASRHLIVACGRTNEGLEKDFEDFNLKKTRLLGGGQQAWLVLGKREMDAIVRQSLEALDGVYESLRMCPDLRSAMRTFDRLPEAKIVKACSPRRWKSLRAGIESEMVDFFGE